MSIFKACDIRGVFGTELTVEHAAALGRALAARHSSPDVLVGGDGRLSTPVLKNALIRALAQSGKRVLDLGRVPTPAFYFARRRLGVPVGVMVTASHNPAADNGFKIVLGDLPITEAELAELAAAMESPAQHLSARVGAVARISILEDYAAFIKNLCPARGRRKLVIDGANGMLGPTAPAVCRALGYRVVELFSAVDGRFPHHPPNPAVAANLGALCVRVQETGADLGVAFDGDGDRVAFVDERGNPVENDRVIVLMARQALAARPGATIVYDQKCSEVVREEVIRCSGRPCMERSGYTFIKTALLQAGAAYAGELSGHHFFAETCGDDALLAALKLAQLVQAARVPLSQLVSAIPHYAITPDIRLPVEPGERDEILGALRQNLRGAVEIDTTDGVRARFEDGWGLVRASVTEPVITIRFEGKTPEALQRIMGAFRAAAPRLAGKL